MWKLTFLLLGICFLSLTRAALVDRPLYVDGIYWTFEILNRGSFYWDSQFTRYADLLFQIPAVVALKLNFSELFSLKLNNLSYSLHPFLSLAACFLILKKRRRTELMVFPVFSFAAVTQTVIGIPFVLVSGLLSFFRPAAFFTGPGFYF